MLTVTERGVNHEVPDLACCHTAGHDDQLVLVRAHWNEWHTAYVRIADLEDIHWSHPMGAPRPLIYASVSCRRFVSGVLPHSCDGRTPHRLQICILKCHTAGCVFQELAARATTRRER